MVLLRIQYLQQGRGRIALVVVAKLVDLVQHDHRVGGAGLFHPLDDAPRQSANVGTTVAADLGLVPHPSQGHAHELASHGPGDGFAQRGFADTGRTNEAEDRPLHLLFQLAHRQEFQDTFLDLVQIEVVIIKDFLCTTDIQAVTRGLAPRNLHQPVQVGTDNARFTGVRVHILQPTQLFEGLFEDHLGHLGGLDRLANLDQFLFFAAVAQFLLDGAHLLTQVILTLVLAHLFACGALDLGLDAQQLNLAVEEFVDLGQTHNRVVNLQQCLGIGHLQTQVAGDQVTHAAGVLDILQDNHHLGRHLLAQFNHFGQLFTDRTDQCLGFQRDIQQKMVNLALGANRVKRFICYILGNAGLGEALNKNLHPSVR